MMASELENQRPQPGDVWVKDGEERHVTNATEFVSFYAIRKGAYCHPLDDWNDWSASATLLFRDGQPVSPVAKAEASAGTVRVKIPCVVTQFEKLVSIYPAREVHYATEYGQHSTEPFDQICERAEIEETGHHQRQYIEFDAVLPAVPTAQGTVQLQTEASDAG